MSENKNNGIFIAALLVIGAGVVWAINKFIPKKDSNQNSQTLNQTPSTFNYKTFLNGKWKMTYTDGTTSGVETGTITNGDTYTIDGGDTRKLINISYNPETKTIIFTQVHADGSEMPETKAIVNESAKTMTGTNGGWDVVYTKVSSSTQTPGGGGTPQPTPTTGIQTFTDGKSLDNDIKVLKDKNGFLIADNVSKYDTKTDTVTYTNGYKLDLKKGLLTSDLGTNLTQSYNANNLTIDTAKTYFPYPVKIVGYSLENHIFYYIDGDLTPYSLSDSFYEYFVHDYVFNQDTYAMYFTNIKHYNALVGGNGFSVKAGIVFRIQTQYDSIGKIIKYNHNSGIGWRRQDNINWNNVMYIYTNWGGSMQLVGAGVTKYNQIANVVTFDDAYYLDITNQKLYNNSGSVVNSNVISYIGNNAFQNGVGVSVDNNGELVNLTVDKKINFPNNPLTISKYYSYLL